MSRASLKNVSRLLDITKKNNEPEKSFLEDLKRSIEMDANRPGDPLSKTYKPSSMKCLRSMYYMVTGTQPDPGTTGYCMVGICNSGTDIHVRTQQAIERMRENGIDCEYVNVGDYVRSRNLPNVIVRYQSGMETKLYNDKYNISFMCDGIIRYNGKYYIIELKTETIHKWGMRKEVNPEHYNQAIAYSLSLGLEDVIFVYICRDNLDMKSYMYHVTQAMRDELVGKIQTCDEYVAKKEAPPVPYDFDKHICQYCGYVKTCNMEKLNQS